MADAQQPMSAEDRQWFEEKAKEVSVRFERIGKESRGKPVTEVELAVRRELKASGAMNFSDADVTMWATDLSAGRRVYFKHD